MDCFADDRESLNDFAKYFNNAHLADVLLLVGDESLPAHRVILAKSSEVFDRMLSQKWSGEKKEIELVEEPQCQKVFSVFLRFLYCNHVLLQSENTLPILVLADKYNVNSLRKVCIDYAISFILPELALKQLFHIWFSYSTKAYHQTLIQACIQLLSGDFQVIISSEEWERDWLSVDRDQLTALLRSNQLRVANEYKLWEALEKWLMAPARPERKGSTAAPLLAHLLPLIRFPLMTANELSALERSPLVNGHPKLFMPQILLAYKFQALSLESRSVCKEFTGSQFLQRNYGDIRWDKRFTVSAQQLFERNCDHIFPFTTRSSALPAQTWRWTLKLTVTDDVRLVLAAEEVDQSRSVEFLLALVDEKKVLRSATGRKTYCSDLELDKRLDTAELFDEKSSLLVDNQLNLQITLRPID